MQTLQIQIPFVCNFDYSNKKLSLLKYLVAIINTEIGYNQYDNGYIFFFWNTFTWNYNS